MSASPNYHHRMAQLEDRVETLEAKNAYLESELGLAVLTDHRTRLVLAGLTLAEATLVLTMYQTRRYMTPWALFEMIDHPKDGNDLTAIRIHICRIKKKLGEGLINHVRRVGYGLTAEGAERVRVLLTEALRA